MSNKKGRGKSSKMNYKNHSYSENFFIALAGGFFCFYPSATSSNTPKINEGMNENENSNNNYNRL